MILHVRSGLVSTRLIIGLLVLAVFLVFLPAQSLLAHEGDNHYNVGGTETELEKKLEENRQEQERVRKFLAETRSKKVTLQNEISYQDNQIKLTTLKIEETEAEIISLTGQIDRLEIVLSDLSKVFAQRAVETYKLKRLGDSLVLLISSSNVSEFISRFHYLKKLQEHDRTLLLQVQSTQTNYEDKRTEVEVLHAKLEQQKVALAVQKAQKQNLLEVTKNDEKKYQELLVALRADEQAIERALSSLIARIVAGIATGSEVTKGKIIGQQGYTGNVYPRPPTADPRCSPNCGSHLHYMVLTCNILQSGMGCHTDPRPYLDNGDYRKPLDYRYISQEYGRTSFAQSGTLGYTFHTGLDLVAFHGAPIYAIAGGTIYYGVDGDGGKYALIKHRDDFWTAYWHLQ